MRRLGIGVAGALLVATGITVHGSSHREALSILNEPCADNTDTFAWVFAGERMLDASTALQEEPRRPRPERSYQPSDQAAVEEIGTVKWYNPDKGFGFIVRDRGGKDIFVHASALNRGGIADLSEGQRVAVDMVEGGKGPEAINVRLV